MPPVEECLSLPASKLWGIYSPAERGSLGEYPLVAIDVKGVEYRLFRHPLLYHNTRVQAYIREFWNRRNTEQPKDPDLCTGWEMQAMDLYFSAYTAAKELRERMNGRKD